MGSDEVERAYSGLPLALERGGAAFVANSALNAAFFTNLIEIGSCCMWLSSGMTW